MNRLDAIDLARAHALAHGQAGDHAYLPSTDAEAAEWLPHAWVVDAIVSAATERERATDDTGFQARYRLPGGKWSSWGHVVCGVKGHEMELREVSGDARRHIVCVCPDCAWPEKPPHDVPCECASVGPDYCPRHTP